MITYLYLDYGSVPELRLQLKYSYLTLRESIGEREAEIVVYTDAEDAYSQWPVKVEALDQSMRTMLEPGGYPHRIKPCVVLDALKKRRSAVVFLDCDSVVRRDFHDTICSKLSRGVIMNRLEGFNPWPAFEGRSVALDDGRIYQYDPDRSWMFNSGIIGVWPSHGQAMEDALKIIDGLWRPGERELTAIEQFAVSEAFRLHGIAIEEVYEAFLHYHRKSFKRYMASRLSRLLKSDWNDLSMPKRRLVPTPARVRLFSWGQDARRMAGKLGLVEAPSR